MISFSNVNKYYKDLIALENIDFTIPEKSVFGLLGPNGSGKSTLMKILAGLITSWEGDINVYGESIKYQNQYLKNFGFMIEEPSFYEQLTANKNLELFARLTNTKKNQINRVLKIVNLYQRKNDEVSTFSYGMKQRLGIAQAILHDPSILILDEPNNGLDPIGINQMADIIHKLNFAGKTICISTHSLYEVERLCTDVAILKKGRLRTAKNLSIRNNKMAYYRLETSNLEKAIDLLESLIGVRVISKHSTTILFCFNEIEAVLNKDKLLSNDYIHSINFESSLIKYFYD